MVSKEKTHTQNHTRIKGVLSPLFDKAWYVKHWSKLLKNGYVTAILALTKEKQPFLERSEEEMKGYGINVITSDSFRRMCRHTVHVISNVMVSSYEE